MTTADRIERAAQAVLDREHAEDVAEAIQELPALLDAAQAALDAYNKAAWLVGGQQYLLEDKQ